MVRISVSETYDLSTKLNKMSLIGIKTPKIDILKRAYGGLLSQYRLMRYSFCDVKLACASVLPADPLQVGVESGDIAPQDMFNPILFKAVSNQGMNQFELRMHGIVHDAIDTDRFVGQSLDKTDNVTGSAYDEFSIYYSLLANRKGWRVAHPQRGLTMRHLKPYVYERLFNEGDAPTYEGERPTRVVALQSNGTIGQVDDSVIANGGFRSLRGRPRPMPFVPVSTILPANASADTSSAYDSLQFEQVPDFKDLTTYCGLILMPPAKLNRFYYRLVIRWYIDLKGLRPQNEISQFYSMEAGAPLVYGSDYTISQSKNEQMGMVDVRDAEIEKIMEGA